MQREELKNPKAVHRCGNLERARKVAEAKAYLTGVGVDLYLVHWSPDRFLVAVKWYWTANNKEIIGTVRLIDGVAEWH